MAVARILTHSPHEAEPLAAQLRARGYKVEVAAPESPQAGAAEVEITLECCDAQDALARAGAMAAGEIDVFVARGALAAANTLGEHAPAIQPATVPAAVDRGRQVRAAAEAAAAAWGRVLHRTGELAATGAVTARGMAQHMLLRLGAQRELWRKQRRVAAQHRERQRAAKPKAAPTVARTAMPKPRPQRERLPVIRRTRTREREWRTAAVFAFGLAAAIMLGWVAANRRPAEPVPTSVIMRSNSMQQAVPFGPVTLPAPATAEAQKASLPARPAATARRGVTRDFADEVVVRHLDGGGKTPPRRAPAADEAYGDDVVVRHFTPASADHAPAPEPAVKRTIVND